MSSGHIGHIDHALLLEYRDGELEGARARNVREHLDVCETCRNAMTEIEDALREYKTITRGTLPAPPREWLDLRTHLEKTESRRGGHFWWMAAAAGIAAVALVIRLSTGQSVSAAELLDKASRQPEQPKRITIKTKGKKYVRSVRQADSTELAAAFRQANFNWDDPLNPRSFAEWRNSLADKRDVVRIMDKPQRAYRITTSTSTGALNEVSIVIRAADLRAVEERFEFRNNDWVEITEATSEEENVRPTQRIAANEPSREQTASVSTEIQVAAALHSLGADLGEPIEAHRKDGVLEIVALGASEARQQQIRNALKGIGGVQFRFEQPQAIRSAGDASARTEDSGRGALHAQLLSLMGSPANVEAFTNSALEASEAVLSRAYALKQLRDRFPSRDELGENDRATLRSIEEDHIRELRAAANRLTAVLEPLTGPLRSNAAIPSDVRSLLNSAQRFDTLLNLAIASGEPSSDADAAVARLRRALSELDAAIRAVAP